MFALRFTSDAHARSKNGHPAQNTTGVARIKPTQLISAPYAMVYRPPSAMSAIVIAKIGAVRIAPTRKRRSMSTSSGFGASDSETTRGSSAIPQIGHGPGTGLTISGCIGHVYSAPAVGRGGGTGGGIGRLDGSAARNAAGLLLNRSRQRGLQK